MIDVFVSRPTWVPKLFRPGLDGFLRTLSDMGLRSRTIGVTDYPVDGAFDEVTEVMNECQGAVILGYPQIWILDGIVKDSAVEDEMTLPTEWNHIEAALAMAMSKPVLIIPHTGITRRVFDRGALNKHIYETDLTNTGWPTSEHVHGALERWRDQVNSAKAIRPKSKFEQPTEIEPSSPETINILSSASAAPLISPEQLKALIFIVINEGRTAGDVARHLGVSEPKAQYFIDILKAAKMVTNVIGLYGPTTYYPEDAGRAILFERGLLD